MNSDGDLIPTITIPSPQLYAESYNYEPEYYLNKQATLRSPVTKLRSPLFFPIFKKKVSTYFNCLPTIDSLLNQKPICRQFGVLNEIEYSSNIRCVNVTFPKQNDNIVKKDRYYYTLRNVLFVNEKSISTNYFNDSHKVPVDVYTRLDYSVDGELMDITSKLKMVKDRFMFDDKMYTLTGSIEVDMPELKEILEKETTVSSTTVEESEATVKESEATVKESEVTLNNRPTKFSKHRSIVQWSLLLHVPEHKYPFLFRVAFRHDSTIHDDEGTYDCNIECEDLISPTCFVECFDFLYKYYYFMHISQGGYMTPLLKSKNSATEFIRILTNCQCAIMNTMIVVDSNYVNVRCREYIKLPSIDSDVERLIKDMGIKTFAMFDDRSIKYDFFTLENISYQKINYIDDSIIDESNEWKLDDV